jgi:chromosome segregation ATPase
MISAHLLSAIRASNPVRRAGITVCARSYATTTSKQSKPQRFQLKPGATPSPSTKTPDATPKKTSQPVNPIPIEDPTLMDDLPDLNEIPSVPSASRAATSTTSTTSDKGEKSTSSDPTKDLIKDLKAQLSQANKERNTLKQSVTLLQQENHSLKEERALVQNQLQQHSAVEAIYSDSGFVQLKNMLKELAPEETSVLRAYGFELETIDHQLEQRQKDVTVSFTTHTATDIAKHINNHLKRLRDVHKQSSSAATASQQTLKNAGMPESVINNSVASLQAHLEELQTKLARWEKLKADVDLLLATYN